MSTIPATTVVMPKPASVYTGVKIRVNNPSVSTFNDNNNGRGNYNAVDIEVNNPKVNTINQKVYDYPKHDGVITYDKTGIQTVRVPQIPVTPVAYTTINNKTLINARYSKPERPEVSEKTEQKTEVSIPEANVTTVKAEKNPSFNGLANVEIVPSFKANPSVDINAIIAKLSDKNFDIQAIQLEQIARTAIENPVEAIPYITPDIYISLSDIMQVDSSKLEKPTKEQIEARKKIIVNEIVKEQAAAAGHKADSVELPYKLTKQEMINASKLSPFEQAERNKEYAILTSALLTKIYTDSVKKETGNPVPLTDLPGVSNFVNILRQSENADVKMTAIDALLYIKQPEYKEELKAIFALAAKDSNPFVAKHAQNAVASVEK